MSAPRQPRATAPVSSGIVPSHEHTTIDRASRPAAGRAAGAASDPSSGPDAEPLSARGREDFAMRYASLKGLGCWPRPAPVILLAGAIYASARNAPIE